LEIVPSSVATGFAVVLSLSASLFAEKAPAPFAGSAVRGQTVYQKACTGCHGELGNGKGQGAHALYPKPRDFTRGLYKYRTTGYGELPTDEDLVKTLNQGLYGTQMPAFRNTLTSQEIADVVTYIKKFSPDFDAAEEAPTVIAIPEAPASTPELVTEGKSVYMALDCWSCHGGLGKGNGPASKSLVDVWGDAIVPRNLTRPQIYRRGPDAVSIYRTIHTGLNGTPMAAFEGALSFGGDKVVSDSVLSEVYSAAEIKTLKDYLASQPTTAKINAMDDESKESVRQQRAWALVHYVRSFQKKTGIVSGLFLDDTEVTK
jgi:mono/diheme cytochrome c family protein